jgi:hypothetical protein
MQGGDSCADVECEALRARVVGPPLECIPENRDAGLGNQRGDRHGETARSQRGGHRRRQPRQLDQFALGQLRVRSNHRPPLSRMAAPRFEPRRQGFKRLRDRGEGCRRRRGGGNGLDDLRLERR